MQMSPLVRCGRPNASLYDKDPEHRSGVSVADGGFLTLVDCDVVGCGKCGAIVFEGGKLACRGSNIADNRFGIPQGSFEAGFRVTVWGLGSNIADKQI
jgi:hypothetical protein